MQASDLRPAHDGRLGRMLTHGMYGSPEYRAWESMKYRCMVQTSQAYRLYGALGVSVHAAWVDDFQAFYDYIGPRPAPKHSLDRFPDNKGNYDPGNVRWATWEEQENNKPSVTTYTIDGEALSVSQWCRRFGIKHTSTVFYRLRQGMTILEALSTPTTRRKKQLKDWKNNASQ